MFLTNVRFRYIFFTWALLVLIYRYYAGLLIHQWASPTQFDPYIDFTMWSMSYTSISRFIVEKTIVAYLFDIVFVSVTVVNIFVK